MRTQYLTRPYERLMEVYQDFSGGLNTVSAPDSMLDTELNDMLNEDIGTRGSLKRRYGMTKVRTLPAGQSQGYFRYYKLDGTFEEYHAVGGKIYNSAGASVTITGLSSFQATRIVEGVQFNGVLYIATGTKVVQYDGSAWSVVNAYAPTTIEMMIVGPNALAQDPEGHLSDTIGTVAGIDYVYPTQPSGAVNEDTYVKVFCTKVNGESYEYAVQIQRESITTPFTDPTTGFKALAGDRTILVPSVSTPDDYIIRVVMRKVGTTTILSEYLLPYHYDLLYTPHESPGTYTIHQCNRALVYNNRLFLYGDPDNPAVVYLSQVNAPDYFPALLTLEFENPRREGLNCLVPYRNGLLAFTRTSTQILTGTSPDDFERKILHTEFGCISPYGAAVMQNQIGFVSTHGIFTLKTSSFTDDKASVEKIDIKVENKVPLDDDEAIAVYEENQLKIMFPQSKTRLRYYDNMRAWTYDYSNHFDATGIWQLDGDTFLQKDGGFYRFDSSVFNDDDYNYTNMWESKYLAFGQPYHRKKLRELQILAAPNDIAMNCSIFVYADENAVITPDDSYASVVNGVVVWNTVFENNLSIPNTTRFDDGFKLGESTLGHDKFALEKLTLTGKCQRTRVRVENTEPNENQFIGFAYIFKLKKPN